MRLPPALALLLAAGLLLSGKPAGPAPALAQPAPTCTFRHGFQVLRDLIPDLVGACLEDERYNPRSGNAEQRTTGGLLVWRKTDNWTAFTDGHETWINGPNGLERRLNAQRFAWEPAPLPELSPRALSRALLTLEDLGEDWREVSPWLRRSASYGDCGQSSGFEPGFPWQPLQYGDVAAFEREEPFQFVGQSLLRFPGPGPAPSLAHVAAFVEACPEWRSTGQDGTTQIWKQSLRPVAAYGDKSIATRTTVEPPTPAGRLVIDNVYVNRENVTAGFGFAWVGSPDSEPPEMEALVALVDERLALLLRSSAWATSTGPGSEVVLVDDFDGEGGRLVKSAERSWSFQVGYEDGQYVIRATDPRPDELPFALIPGLHVDASLRVDVRLTGEVQDRIVSLACRDAFGPSTGYRFNVRTEPGGFWLERWDDGKRTLLVDWQRSSAVYPGGAVNRLDLTCSGTRISAYINGLQVASVVDEHYRWGQFWMGVQSLVPGGAVEARFDNLVVTLQPNPDRAAASGGASTRRLAPRVPGMPWLASLPRAWLARVQAHRTGA